LLGNLILDKGYNIGLWYLLLPNGEQKYIACDVAKIPHAVIAELVWATYKSAMRLLSRIAKLQPLFK